MNPLKRFARLFACVAALAVVAAPILSVPVAAKDDEFAGTKQYGINALRDSAQGYRPPPSRS